VKQLELLIIVKFSKKEFFRRMNKFLIKYSQGFSLTETLVGIFITTIICSFLLLGISQAKLFLNSVRIKEKALYELKIWTDQWKSIIATGAERPSIITKEVPLLSDADSNNVIIGKLNRQITLDPNSGTYSKYYNLYTSIKWKKENFFFNINPNTEDSLFFNLWQIKFHIK